MTILARARMLIEGGCSGKQRLGNRLRERVTRQGAATLGLICRSRLSAEPGARQAVWMQLTGRTNGLMLVCR
jgi:hypothetical protein